MDTPFVGDRHPRSTPKPSYSPRTAPRPKPHKSLIRIPNLGLCLPAPPTHALKEDITLGELADSGEGVLDNAHDRAVGLGGDDHSGDHGQLLDLSSRLQGLREVEVHLVPIEIRIVGGGDAVGTVVMGHPRRFGGTKGLQQGRFGGHKEFRGN